MFGLIFSLFNFKEPKFLIWLQACKFSDKGILSTVILFQEQEAFMPKAWQTVGNTFKFLQLMSILEVLNPLFGYTKVISS